MTPLYDSLTTNLAHPTMAFPGHSFPPSTPLFPVAAVVEEYLRSYARTFDLLRHITLKTTVTSAAWNGASWTVETSDGAVNNFDRLIIANGHYRVPAYPDAQGLHKWLQKRKATHAAWYRKPYNLGKVVLVVGSGPSGHDISAEMREFADIVFHSVPGATPEDSGNLKRRGRVVRFFDENTVEFEDQTMESGIDHCILATGYHTSFPFLRGIELSMPEPVPPFPRHLHDSSFHVFPLAKELFPIQVDFPPTSIAFMGLPIKVVPFPLFEAQASAIVKVFSEPDSLNLAAEAVCLINRFHELSREHGGDATRIAKAWHRYKNNYWQWDYRDALHEFASASSDPLTVPEWEKEMYDRKDDLRKEWRALEESGEADERVKSVGEGGFQEWVDFMRTILRRVDSGGGTAKL
ncbi:FAD/NAD(P)-binding domain-containing protein [Rickenella mellea]|uniref:FAD/NAD(P)-binding domain-containing protein n=1 Tax=Rickenella mellea TaxID=50990 RepID=A0A4Y7Q5K3_9AGAM|nr:FAD/NAD(P)-binding domain-containing protein [Rickenella mellea]